MADMALPAPPLTVRSIVARTVRGLPAHKRRVLWISAAVWVALCVLQYLDSADRPDARGLAEFSSVVLGTLGFMVIAFVQVLREVTKTTCRPGTTPDAVDQSVATRQILMSLPVLAGLGAVLIAAAVAWLIARVWLGTSLFLLLPAAVYLLATVFGLKLARDASARLYALGQADAARASRVEAELASARLSALQAQMHPHFLFNALNTVASLTQTNPRAAESTVEQLADVLRVALDRTGQPMSTVGDEVRFVRAYLGVEGQRFGDRLRVEWQIDPALDRVPVPSFSLQPLVENAIKHGLSARAAGGRLAIRAEREPGGLVALTVEDDGDGFDPKAEEGTGLGNLRGRLAALYGGAARLDVEGRDTGARVVVRVPATAPEA